MNVFGLQALIDVVCQIFFVLLAFWAIQGVHFERFLPIQEKQGKVLIVMCSIAIGFLCSSFFLSFIENIKNLTLLF